MNIKNISVIGLGTLGTQIAVQAACYGCNVRGYDQDPEIFLKKVEELKFLMLAMGKDPTVPKEDWGKAAATVKLTKDLAEALADADLVIEAVPEVLELKRKVFAEMDTLAPKAALLATNSSSIPISRIEDATKRPEKCLNMHFYQPALGFTLCDIMGGTKTSPEVIEGARQWVRSLDLTPLKVKKEILGFCFNSVWRAVKKQVLYMACNGFVDYQDIDRAWRVFTGMPYGPFTMMDMVGLDVVYDIEMSYYNESKDPKDLPPQAFKDMIDRKELGAKTGKGFYTYPNPDWAKPDFLKG
ncbi:MAG: 3-hydroxyacyl-CoA dehydrogenase [Deltaproteobacteria bacterium HGW-Deltaproteobacteria-19]|jgi:3-hydroxybutyryl-CoA dehydrogenase|nr:MAG: 3-hydroxyacyl-CoA dehydrogenase [Deltaproteobacteria bacterium HGW-Deltaproteobacteria-19]